MSQIIFSKKNKAFFEEVKEKVEDYFSSKRIGKTGDSKLYLKSILCLALTFTSYLMIMLLPLAGWISLLLCAVIGFSFAGMGFNVMHDGAHGSYSKRKWLNELVSYSLNLMGGNVFIWKHKHNLAHHNFTNIEGMDDDIDIKPWMRTNRNQPRRWFHRYQHIYGLPLYGITYINWVFINDFKNYFAKKVANTPFQKMNFKEHLIFWVSKVLHIALILVLPILKFGLLKTLLGFGVMAFCCGFTLGTIFQLAHVIDETDFPLPEEESNQMEQNWVLHQIATTVNFAPENRVIFWLTGGLNFQIVHHLFPKVSHIHYPAINKLIRESCIARNIKYKEYPTFFGAVRAHVNYLKMIGAN